MRSFTHDDDPAIPGAHKANVQLDGADITPEMLRVHIERAERMRAEMMSEVLRGLGRALVRPVRRLWRQAPASEAAEADGCSRLEGDLKTPITSIRAAAEILRDHADVPVAERARFLEVIIEDSRRLELYTNQLLDENKPNADRGGRLRCKTGRDRRLDRQAA